ncbi:MAG TPA: hypothetical protein VGL97_05675 [Bryobacteraceae bacterium]
MTNEDDGSYDGRDPTEGAAAASKAEPKATVPSKPATEADLANVEEKMNGFERSTLRWTRASFFIVLATAVFIGLQWLEMRSGGADTHTLAEAAKKQAEKAETISNSVAQAVVELKASATAAQGSVNAIKAQMRTQQRAWLQINSTAPNIPDDGPIRIAIQVENIGNTPATGIRGDVVVTVHKRDEMPRFIYKGQPRYRITQGLLFPHKNIDVTYEALRKGAKKPDVILFDSTLKQETKAGTSYIVAHGYIRYVDAFKQHHWLKFCDVMRVNPDILDNPKAYKECVAYNSVDSN